MLDYDDVEEDQNPTSGPKALRDAYEAEKTRRLQAEQALAEAEEARRKLALIEAGIDLKSPTGQLFADAYKGDLTQEAIAEAAARYGVIAPPAQSVTVPPQEQQAWSGMAQTNAGAGSVDALTPSDMDRLKQARTPSEIEALVREINERGQLR